MEKKKGHVGNYDLKSSRANGMLWAFHRRGKEKIHLNQGHRAGFLRGSAVNYNPITTQRGGGRLLGCPRH